MHREGAARTPEEMQRSTRALKNAVEQVKSGIERLKKEDAEIERELNIGLGLMAEIMREYTYFDIHYSDGTYAAAQTNEASQRVLKVIEEHKNDIRSDLNTVFFDDGGYLPRLLKQLEGVSGVQADILSWYTEEELKSLAFEGISVSEESLSSRKELCVFIINDKLQRELYTNREAERIAALFEETPTRTDVIRGVVAHGGGRKVVGKVKIIRRDYARPDLTQKAMTEMEQGQILVTETTDPDLMEGFRKAGAVVTDIGGMLSHAAITARELDIPCVIGAVNASRSLKDGDMVEVDTTSGTIKRL
jgi:phosphohistidine swiveling domain-containing protein